jgi:MHS family proline/betaine transporter-like MFS transporter
MSSLVMFSLYFPTYLSQHFAFKPEEVYYAITWGLVWSAIILPFVGLLSDKWGKKELMLVTCLSFLALSYFYFKMIQVQIQAVLVLFMMIYQTFIACVSVCYWPLLAELFPTKVRYTALAVCYNITYSIMGCLPMIVTGLIQTFESAQLGIFFLMGCALITAVSCAGLWFKSSNPHKAYIH